MSQHTCQWFLWFSLICSAGNEGAVRTGSAPASPAPDNYKITRWTTENGLPQNRVTCLQQTRDGYLWIGSWFGLARFDGIRFVTYNRENTPAFPSDAINALAEDTSGTLWIATPKGLLNYRQGVFHRFTQADGLPADEMWRLTASAQGGLWILAGDSLVRYQHKFSTIWKYPPQEIVRAMTEGRDGHLNLFLKFSWLDVTTGGVVRTNYVEAAQPPFLPHSGRFWSGDVEKPGVALISTTAGLLRVHRGETNRVILDRFQGQLPLFLLHDIAGNIWVQAEKNHLWDWDGVHWETYNLGEAASDAICAERDREGSLWLGTVDGLVRLQFPGVRNFGAADGLPGGGGWSVCEGADGTLWVATDQGLAMTRNNWQTITPIATNWSGEMFESVWPASDGSVWAASKYDGVFRIKNGQIAETISNAMQPSALYEDKTGRLWIGRDELRLYQDGQPQSLPAALKSLRDIHSILEDDPGNFWFGLHDGTLACWRTNKFSVFTARDGLSAGGIWCLYEDRDGCLWLGTENGLVRFENGHFFHFTVRQGLPPDTINWILEDDAGDLWLSTLHGIYRLDREQLNQVAEGRLEAAQPFIVGTADGLKTAESNGEYQPAGWKAHDGRLWFAMGAGITVIDPKLFPKTGSAPPVLFESVKADGRELFNATNDQITVGAGHGHALEIHFTACDLAAPEQISFRTRVAGASDWSEPSADRSVSYFNLRPGHYRVEVKVTDHHGVESIPAGLDLSLAPCFWQTTWFYLSGGGVLLALAAGIQGYRSQWRRRLLKLEQQRALANERARIARDLHDDLGTALTGVALELDVLGRDAQSQAFSPLVDRLAKSSGHVRNLAERMREVVWTVNPRCDNLRSLADFLEDQAASLLQKAGLKVRLEFPEEIPDLPVAANVRHQLALSVREAFTNLIRHAQATEAHVRLELSAEQLVIRIRDNGRGFKPSEQRDNPHGLANLKLRLEQIGGSFTCDSAPGQGATLVFAVPRSQLKTIPASLP